jgi:uncharacterized protein YfaS (alpha-2-macroglobulin family)
MPEQDIFMTRSVVRRAAVALAIMVPGMLSPLASQSPSLTIVSATPQGDIGQIADANEIRIVFSEPMIAVGGPTTGVPDWFSITPAVNVNAYWSGTRTLIVTPDPDRPLPFSTQYRVRISPSARSVAGRAMGNRFEFAFTTPTVRLLSTTWYRPEGRADRPAVIRLQFNQPVDPKVVAAHAWVRYQPHQWRPPVLTPEERERWRREDRENLARFDAKVAGVARVAASNAPVPIGLADRWDEERFPRAANTVVLQTLTAPSSEGWLQITLDGTLTGTEGEVPHAEQSSTIQLEPAWLVDGMYCYTQCNPDGRSPINFRAGLALDEIRRVVTVTDISQAAAPRPVPRGELRDPGWVPEQGFRSADPQLIGIPYQPPVSRWLYSIGASARSVDGQALGYRWSGLVATAHATPYAQWSGQVWEARGGTSVPFLARNVVSAIERMAPMAAADVIPALQALLQGNLQARLGRGGRATPPPAASGRERRFDTVPDAHDAHGINLAPALSSAGTGLVWASVTPVEALSGTATDRGLTEPRPNLIQVTNLGLTVKDSPQSTLVMVTTLDSAQPVASAHVTIRDRSNTPIWTGVTDRDGVAMAPALPVRDTARQWELSYVVTAEKNGDVAWVASDWSGDHHPSRFGLSYQLEESKPILRGSVFTDRGVYAAGDRLKVKTILRMDTVEGMRSAEGATLTAVVRDARGREVDTRTLQINRWGGAEWEWQVPAGAALGHYNIHVRMPSGQAWDQYRSIFGSFLVAAFRRPDFRVDAAIDADQPILGERLTGTLTARYLFGGSIGAQPVRWTAWRQFVHKVPAQILERYPERQFAFGYLKEPGRGERAGSQLADANATLSREGGLRVSVPTAGGDDAAAEIRFEGDVVGVSGQHIADRATMVMHPASIYVGLTRPAYFVDVRQGLTTEVVAADLAGAARAGVLVTVALFRQEWKSKRRSGDPWSVEWERTEVPAGSWQATTTTGRVPLKIPLRDGGSYVLRATATDDAGRITRTDVSFYGFGGGRASWRSEGNRIDLTPERRTWSPGETARILVQSPWERATALVTTEREGIRSHRRVDIVSTQDTITVPITEADIPNVFVSVLLLKGRTSEDPGVAEDDAGQPAFRLGYTELTVDDAVKRLAVTVAADRAEYRPRGEVKVDVHVADVNRRPAAGEVTLWAMDYGLLSLTGYTVPDVARAIYAKKSLQVQTQDNRSRLIGRRRMVSEPQGRGAGGGGAGRSVGMLGGVVGGIPAPPPIGLAESVMVQSASATVSFEPEGQSPELRTDFRPLVFWVGSLTTGADGRASTVVTLPDSLTTYRIMAVAGDLTSHFGAGETEIRASKPLTLLPAFPRFLSQGDRASFGAVVTNGTAAGGVATVTVRSMDAPLGFEGETTSTVRLAPGESQPVRFDARALAAGTARIRITVTLGGETDAFELALPVIAPQHLETVAAYGDTTATATERLAIPAGVIPSAGGLTISMASTALVGLSESARYLDDFAYECAEPIASRALALLLSADLGGAFGTGQAAPAQRDAGLAALTELTEFQCGDGGYAMFRSRCLSSPYLTAYVLHVLKVASSLGARTDGHAIDAALNYLQQHLRQPPPEAQHWPAWAASQAYALKVLAEYGRKPVADITLVYGAADRLPVFALSYLADALAASGDRGARYTDVVRRITNAIRVDADRAHVEEMDDASLVWLWNSNVRATAVVLEGLARRGDSALMTAPIVRWLLAERQNGRWSTTQENGVTLNALVAYYRAQEPEVPRMTVTTRVGAAVAGTMQFEGRSTVAQEARVAMIDLAATPAANLTIERTGTGRVYYTTRLQYARSTPPAPVERGLRFSRTYERLNADGSAEPTTSFGHGDLVRVTVSVQLPHEGRYLAITDPVPAGLELIDGALKTTASDLGRVATTQSNERDAFAWWRLGGFDHVEKHDDRVVAFATRLAAGRHEISYLARATTTGTFEAMGTWGEALYAPEITGRTAATRIVVR